MLVCLLIISCFSAHFSFCSVSFAGLGYLSLSFANRLAVFRRPRAWKFVIFIAPWFGALMIALTRVNDYRHHWSDVFSGGILGTLITILAYRQYYPSLIKTNEDLPIRDRQESEPVALVA